MTSETETDAFLVKNPLKYKNYNGAFKGDLINNGHSVQFTLTTTLREERRPLISGSFPTSNDYILEQFHFHWGSNGSNIGSEHTVDCQSYPAEIHFVHYNEKYSNVAEAVKHKDGLAVVGFFFEVKKSKYQPSDAPKYEQTLAKVANLSDNDSKSIFKKNFN